jgi:hypothetical protein
MVGVTGLIAFAPDLAWEETWLMPLSAAMGALVATLALVSFARGKSPAGLLLAGLGINALAGATTLGLTAWADESRSTLALAQSGNWLSHVTLELVWLPALAGLVATAGLWMMSHRLNLLGLGETGAWLAGVEPGATGRQAAILTSVAAGAATCLCGPVAFVGLLAPHLARAVVGPRHHGEVVAVEQRQRRSQGRLRFTLQAPDGSALADESVRIDSDERQLTIVRTDRHGGIEIARQPEERSVQVEATARRLCGELSIPVGAAAMPEIDGNRQHTMRAEPIGACQTAPRRRDGAL